MLLLLGFGAEIVRLGQIAAVGAIVITVGVLLTRFRAYSDKYYRARTQWNRMYMCRNCGQRVAG